MPVQDQNTPTSPKFVRWQLLVIFVAAVLLTTFLALRPTSALTNNGSITSFGTPLTEQFDSLASTGTNIVWTDNVTIPGWYSSRVAYNSGTGSSNAGALYSFGAASGPTVSERALGSIGSGSTGTIYYGVRLVNNTGGTITSLDISYIAEQWRTGGSSTATPSVAQLVDFQYQVANAGAITGINNPATGWADFDTLDFSSPIFGTTAAAALDGNAAANRVSKASTLTVTVNSGQEIWLRWRDVDHANNDHGMAIDEFSVKANGAGSTNPSGVGAANPNSVAVGGTTLLTVAVTPGASPTSTGLAVSANLSSIGGSSAQQFFDDGSNGDATPGDNTFSYSATVANGTTGGAKTLPAVITDAQSRTGNANISLTVTTPTPPSGVGAANPSTVLAGASSTLTVTVTPGSNPTSTGITVTGDLSSIGGSSSQQFFNNGTNGDVTAGDNIFSYLATVASNTTAGLKSLPVNIADAQSRTSSASISLNVQDTPIAPGSVVISQVYGGGGNAGATLKNDFIEIFNRTSNTINLNGWSVQYASAGGGAGATWTRKTTLTGSIGPGQYYLIREAAGAGGSVDLPPADDTGTITMGATDGKIALVTNDSFLPNGCPIGNPNVMDFVGYGSADCYEGFGAAPVLTNTTAALRARGGCKDTDYNAANFTAVAPSPRNKFSAPNLCPIGDQSPEVFSTTPASSGTNVDFAANIVINVDEPVGVTGNWFQISCTKSGFHTATVTGGPSTFTLNPDTDFQGTEQCTVTVFASQVNDLDGDDPPDNMSADYTWTFSTVIVRDPAEHMVMGNPSGAVTDVNTPLDYLMMKPQYALSYNNDKGTANWVSWHLDSTWVTGVTDRQDDFRPDDTLPPSFKHVSNGYQFAVYAFDRGHMTPSADRTSSIPDNSATFLMTNMIPQASGNNQGPWNNMEGYIRTQLSGSQNELYIVSGGTGVGGNSANGHFDNIIDTAGNSVTVPQWTWKVVMVLPNADGDDVARVDTSTRTFAVIMPNNDNIREEDWKKYLATVDQVEALSGYNFFSNVPENIQNVIEARLDEVNDTAPVANSQSVTTAEDTQKAITLTASDFNVNNVLTYTIVTPPAHGSLTGTGAALNYLPEQDYFGPDSFTFKVNDGAKDSNVATVSINVTSVNDSPVAVNDGVSTSEDTPLTFPAANLLVNDTAGPANESAQTLAVTSVTTTPDTHGSVNLSAGQVTYTPAANYNGPASFDYQVCDNGTTNGSPDAKCSVATVNVNVSAVNDPPDAVDDSAAVAEDSGANAINVLANDSFVPDAGETLSISATTNGAHGTVAITGGGTGLTYTPNADYFGPDSFTYTISDGNGGTDTATVNINVTPVNDAPVANAGLDQTPFCTAAVSLDGTGSSDVDDASNTLTYVWTEGSTVIASGANPTVALSLGVHTITLTVTDPHGLSSQDTVTITVLDNSLPVITLTGQTIVLESANHQYETINLSSLVASASDSCDPTVDLSDVVISQATSDEAENGIGDGGTSNDIVIAPDCKSVQLRAERAGGGNGRVYTITFLVRDTAGNTTTATAKVTVPKSNNGTAAVDDGPQYTVNSSCQ
jgi:DNA/RNA endonuclease G (NUC1)